MTCGGGRPQLYTATRRDAHVLLMHACGVSACQRNALGGITFTVFVLYISFVTREWSSICIFLRRDKSWPTFTWKHIFSASLYHRWSFYVIRWITMGPWSVSLKIYRKDQSLNSYIEYLYTFDTFASAHIRENDIIAILSFIARASQTAQCALRLLDGKRT